VLSGDGQPVMDELGGLLQQVTQLTGLALTLHSGDIPAALAGLSQLQWLHLYTLDGRGGALPAVSWTHSLRRLSTDYVVATASLPQLAAASRLSHLSLLDLPERGETPEYLQRWTALWHFAATFPPLRTLDFRAVDEGCGEVGKVPAEMVEACMRLAYKRPSLHVAVHSEDPTWPLAELQAMAPAADEG
jgi:hypothetical protein